MGVFNDISIFNCFPSKSNSTTRSEKSKATKRSNTTGSNSNSLSSNTNSSSFNNPEVSYILPNDFDELDRIHQQHWILKHALKGNYQAPVSSLLKIGIKVLDSGCGPGTWTLEMAETYRRSEFVGVDVYPVFPQFIKPSNVQFEIGNIAKRIPFEDGAFDYIHQRLLYLGLTHNDWDNVLSELYRVTKPGGYVELIEPDIHSLIRTGPVMEKIRDKFADLLESRNIKSRAGSELTTLLEKAGYTNIVTKQMKFNINHTDKCGELFWKDFKEACINLRPVMAMDNPKYQDAKVYETVIDECGREAQENKSLAVWYYCYAQKPYDD